MSGFDSFMTDFDLILLKFTIPSQKLATLPPASLSFHHRSFATQRGPSF